MKQILILLLFVALPFTSIFAQEGSEKYDVILKLNGEEMVGKITEINDNEVKFVYKGETLTYSVKKQEIFRITFASGRVEIVNAQKPVVNNQAQNTQAAPVDSHNKVAVLPFGILIDNSAGPDELSEKIQMECYSIMSKKAATMQFQDPARTNALLIKNNVTKETIKGYTMDEVCKILGVEYIVSGFVTLNKANATASSNSYSNSKNTAPAKVDSKGNVISGNDGKTNSSTYSTITQNYKTSILMNVFDERGNKVFSQDHDSFWQSQDAYKSTLEYLAKRTPVYAK